MVCCAEAGKTALTAAVRTANPTKALRIAVFLPLVLVPARFSTRSRGGGQPCCRALPFRPASISGNACETAEACPRVHRSQRPVLGDQPPRARDGSLTFSILSNGTLTSSPP